MPMKKVDNLVYWERVGWKQGCSCLIHYAPKQTQGPSVLLPPQRTKRAPGTPVHALKKARVRLTNVGMTMFLGISSILSLGAIESRLRASAQLFHGPGSAYAEMRTCRQRHR